jgi:hypothetical protein
VEAFESINLSATPENIEVWSAEEEHAQRERSRDVTVMDIYDIKMKRREFDHVMLNLLYERCFSSFPCADAP